MKTLYVADLENGMSLEGETFAVQDATLNETKNGKPYYRVKFGDKTGSIAGQIWSDAFPNIEKSALKPGNVIQVSAVVETYREKLQLRISKVNKVNEAKLEEFVEASDFDLDDHWKKLMDYIERIEDESIKKFMNNVFDDKELAAQYKIAPGAEYVHHSFRGGLIEHVLEMLDLAFAIKPYYPEADYDLVTVGVILHDVGKLFELKTEGMVVQRTTEGALLGHIMKSYELVLEKSKGILDEETLLNIKHIILSHHGLLEYGSPVTPATLEASIVSNVDDVSSNVRIFQKVIRAGMKKEGDFTDYDNILKTRIYKKRLLKKQNNNDESEQFTIA